jgi:phospholipase D1/2
MSIAESEPAPGRAGRGGGGSGHSSILKLGRNVWRLTGVEDSALLVDAADYYRAFYWAARRARSSILISGWQFDSGVPLLRGDERPPGAEVRLLWFLDQLCRQQPGLEMYILAWDFHLVFALEREWMQRVIFHWMTASQLRFQFERAPAPGGSHHQKFVVVDGREAFVGGIDLCESRWDDRCHREDNPLRLSRGRRVKPYHDVQVYLRGGEAPAALASLFRERWARAAREPMAAFSEGAPAPDARPQGALPVGPGRVALSRTDPSAPGPEIAVREVERLYVDAIAAARAMIYVETQYFSSRRVRDALVARLRAADGPLLDVVIIVNERAEALKEEIAVGLRQAKVLMMLRRAAAGTGHRLGLYFTLCQGPHRNFRATYIHSKLMIVDDRFLTVGSANLTNRSLGIDTELQVSWETSGESAPDARLVRAIRRFRMSLLAEHAGLTAWRDLRQLARPAGLVARLDALGDRPGGRLRRHGPSTTGQQAIMRIVDPDGLPFDPEIDEAGRDEPAEERGGSVRAALGRIARALGRRLGRPTD